jgi:hypothetical protein
VKADVRPGVVCDGGECCFRSAATFVCNACERDCCPCVGAADEAPSFCGDCFCRLIVDKENCGKPTRAAS